MIPSRTTFSSAWTGFGKETHRKLAARRSHPNRLTVVVEKRPIASSAVKGSGRGKVYHEFGRHPERKPDRSRAPVTGVKWEVAPPGTGRLGPGPGRGRGPT